MEWQWSSGTEWYPLASRPSNTQPLAWKQGDSCCNPNSMGYIQALIQDRIQDVFVHSVQLALSDDDDRSAGFFGVVFDQLETVCADLKTIPQLKNGFSAIGFSQGGLFLRAYAETCLDGPRIHNLVTFGTAHMGVADAPKCRDKNDANCLLMRALFRNGAYLNWVQHRSVQAQYFNDPQNQEGYLSSNIFLPFVNNQVASKKSSQYKAGIQALEKLALVRFASEETVVPAESSWFGYYDADLNIVNMENQTLYIEDWLGIRWLNENGRIDRLTQGGGHMQIDESFFNNTIIPNYLANTLLASDVTELK
ncbi:Alpha/Beta hydrolase protein [Chytriomyces sp. MP71]|nr:Alpha/Beta hydrolase protein [Chytriomyces sp. MP71]